MALVGWAARGLLSAGSQALTIGVKCGLDKWRDIASTCEPVVNATKQTLDDAADFLSEAVSETVCGFGTSASCNNGTGVYVSHRDPWVEPVFEAASGMACVTLAVVGLAKTSNATNKGARVSTIQS